MGVTAFVRCLHPAIWSLIHLDVCYRTDRGFTPTPWWVRFSGTQGIGLVIRSYTTGTPSRLLRVGFLYSHSVRILGYWMLWIKQKSTLFNTDVLCHQIRNTCFDFWSQAR